MKAWSLILILGLSATSAQAFSGATGAHSGLRPHSRGFHPLGRYGSFALVPDEPGPVEPPSPPPFEPPAAEAPAFAPDLPQPYAIPNARPRRSGPKIIYIGKPPKGDGPRIIYGAD